MMRALGFELSESDIQISAYASEGQIWRDNLYLDYLVATREIAEALKLQTAIVQTGIDEQAKGEKVKQKPTGKAKG